MKNQNYLPKRANLVNIFLSLLAADKAIYSKFWNFTGFLMENHLFQASYVSENIWWNKEEIDGLAEKFVALFGSENLNYKDLCDLELNI